MNSQIRIFIYLSLITILGTVASYQYRFRDLVLIKQAQNQIRKNNPELGFRILDQAAAITTREETIRKIRQMYLSHKKHQELVPLTVKALGLYPSREYLYSLVNSLYQTENSKGAYEYLDKISLPSSLQELKGDYLITLHIDLGEYQEASDMLQKRIDECLRDTSICRYFDKEDPYHEMMLELANVFLLKKQPEEAKEVYLTLLKKYPEDLEIKKRLGEAFLWNNEFDLAAKQFKELYRKSPGNHEIRQSYMESLSGKGDKKELLTIVRSIQDKAVYKKTLAFVIDLYLEKEDLKGAQTLLEEYLEENPDQHDFRLKLAEVLSWQSYFRESARQFELLLADAPENKNIRRLYAQVLSWMGDHKKASEELRKTLEEGRHD
jgi:tetratricopeptide (TPR) repeat protein